MSPVPSRPLPARWVRRVLALLGAFVVGLAVAEIGLRIWLSARGRPFTAEAARSEFARLESTVRDSVPSASSEFGGTPDPARPATRILNPYWAFDHVGGSEILARAVERVGRPEFDDDVEVLVVGGSVAEMLSANRSEALLAAVRAHPEFGSRRIHVYPFGRGGFKQPQQIGLVNFLLGLGLTPEVVLNIDGFNDVALARTNATLGVHPAYPSLSHWGIVGSGGVVDREAIDIVSEGRARQIEVLALVDTANAWSLWRSAIATSVLLRRMNSNLARMHDAFGRYEAHMTTAAGVRALSGPPFGDSPDDVMRSAIRMWSESSRSLRAVCEARRIAYVHVLQPTLHDTPYRTMTEAERLAGAALDPWIEGVHLGYPLLRVAGRELAAGGERFVDGSPLFQSVEETIYVDSCHLNRKGNAMLAEAAAAAIAEALRK